MKACLLSSMAPVENHPLEFADVPVPAPTGDQVLLQVSVCGVCRTDLHVIEGELPQRRSPLIPGHQIVGRVVACGEAATRFASGARVGVP